MDLTIVYGLLFVSEKIIDIYIPTIPIEKIVNPPKNQIDIINDVYPGTGMFKNNPL